MHFLILSKWVEPFHFPILIAVFGLQSLQENVSVLTEMFLSLKHFIDPDSIHVTILYMQILYVQELHFWQHHSGHAFDPVFSGMF